MSDSGALDAELRKKEEASHLGEAGFMNGKKIDHVVVLMLENRGFDHLMGWLYEPGDEPLNHFPAKPGSKWRLPQNQGKLGPFLGLGWEDPKELEVPFDFKDKSGKQHKGKLPLRKGARAANVPRINPHEDFIHILEDMYGGPGGPTHEQMKDKKTREDLITTGRDDKKRLIYKTPGMKGWLHNYGDAITHHAGFKTYSDDQLSEILDMFTPQQVPALSFLARHYAVSDLWFCSVPSQTNTNRAFWAAGTSRGLVTNCFYESYPGLHKDTHADSMPDGTRSLFDVLSEKDVSWKYYWSAVWPPALAHNHYFKNMFPKYRAKEFESRFPMIDQFWKDVASPENNLPKVSYIEPVWGGGPSWIYQGGLGRGVGNEFHPAGDTTNGDFLVKAVYDAISKGPHWETTLLVITFDENGGTYDHLPPWPAEPTGRDQTTSENVKCSKWKNQLDPGTKTQFGFEFDTFGVRVPTLLISPHIRPGTIFRSPTEVPFDHTSIIASILKWRGISLKDANLGERVAKAPTFDGVLQGVGEKSEIRKSGDVEWGTHPVARKGKGKALGWNDNLYLRFVGNKWDQVRREGYLGGPITKGGPGSLGWWYPVVRLKSEALQFNVLGSSLSELKNGDTVQLVVSDGAAKGYRLAVPASAPNSLADTVYLKHTDGKENGSRWRMWLVGDRVEGRPLYSGDEVFFFSEEYWWQQDKKLAVNTGKTGYDPYQKLTVDSSNLHAVDTYAKFQAGEWDIWVLELAGDAPPAKEEARESAEQPKRADQSDVNLVEELRRDVVQACQELNRIAEESRAALTRKWDAYCEEATKAKKTIDMDLLASVQDALTSQPSKAGKPAKESQSSGNTDGAANLMTGPHKDDPNRESCLAQVRNTCGVRAAYNCLCFAGVAKDSHEELWKWAPDVPVNSTEDQIEKFLAAHGGAEGGEIPVFGQYLYWDAMLRNDKDYPPTAGAKALQTFRELVRNWRTHQPRKGAPALQLVLHTQADQPLQRQAGIGHYFAIEITAEVEAGKYKFRYRDSLTHPLKRAPLIQWFIKRYLP